MWPGLSLTLTLAPVTAQGQGELPAHWRGRVSVPAAGSQGRLWQSQVSSACIPGLLGTQDVCRGVKQKKINDPYLFPFTTTFMGSKRLN